MTNIVCYGGAGAGKSTASAYLEEAYGFAKFSFATPLKEIAVKIWGPDAATDRGKLQDLGMKVCEIDEDAWCRLGLEQIATDEDAQNVNDDCRFPNEYWGLKERGFQFVRVLANEQTRVDRLLRIGKLDDPEQLNHDSETAILGLEATKKGIVPDFTVFNNGEPEELYTQIDGVLTAIEEQA